MKEIKLYEKVPGRNMRMSFSIPTQLDGDGNILMRTSGSLCREQVIWKFSQQLMGTKVVRNRLIKTLDKSRVIVHHLSINDTTDKRLKKVLSTINAIEKEIGIKNTIIKKVTIDADPSYNMIMFEGPIQWFRSTHTMSLWLLIIRMSIQGHKKFNSTSFKKLHKLIKDVSKAFPLQTYPNYTTIAGLQKDGWSWQKSDLYHVCKTIDYWLPLMKNLDIIFPHRDKWKTRYNNTKTLEKPKNSVYFPSNSCEGIFYLVEKKSRHKNRHIFYKIMKG